MEDWLSLSHVKWDCKYHVVFIPKYRRKVLYGKVRRQVGAILRDLCVQKGITLLQGNAVLDHVHMVLSIPPKYSVAFTIGWLKGKSAVRIHREVLKERRVDRTALLGAGVLRQHRRPRHAEGAGVRPRPGEAGSRW